MVPGVGGCLVGNGGKLANGFGLLFERELFPVLVGIWLLRNSWEMDGGPSVKGE